MYFVAMTVELEFENRDQPLTAADGVYAHSAIFNTLSEEDAEAGEILHDMKRHKRIALAIVDSDAHTAQLRLSFMAKDGLAHFNSLANALATRPRLQIGKTTCSVNGIDLVDSEWSAISTWADLLSGPHGQYITFSFTTPTAIAKSDGNGNRFFSLFPIPLDIFSGLARRWQALEGPALPEDLEDFIYAGGFVVTRHRLRTTSFRTSRRTQIGFTGSVTYTFLEDDVSCVAALNSLARLAAFTGVGYQTARGMGAVRVRISN
jgi:CRISPR-associated endoribonuclease Cas6